MIVIGVLEHLLVLRGLTMLDLSYILQDMTNTEINTTEPEFKVITDKKDEPDYKAVSKFVGGMVEVVQLPNGDLLLLNEEGKLMGLPLNEKASKLWKETFDNDNYITGRNDFVVGPAILIKKQALNTWAS